MAVGIRKVTHNITRNFMLRKYLMLANITGTQLRDIGSESWQRWEKYPDIFGSSAHS